MDIASIGVTHALQLLNDLNRCAHVHVHAYVSSLTSFERWIECLCVVEQERHGRHERRRDREDERIRDGNGDRERDREKETRRDVQLPREASSACFLAIVANLEPAHVHACKQARCVSRKNGSHAIDMD